MLGFVLAGCVDVLNATPKSVTVRASTMRAGEVDDIAIKHCAAYKKAPRLVRVRSGVYYDFKCVERSN